MAARKMRDEVRLLVSAAGGLHARPAALLVKLAQAFDADIEIALDGQSANAKSILGIMSLGAEGGAQVTVSANGHDAEEAVGAVRKLFASNFGEPGSSPLPSMEPYNTRGKRLLIADDEAGICEVVKGTSR